jgi:hypothetical protein
MVDGEAATTVKSTMVLCCCVPFCAQTVIGKVPSGVAEVVATLRLVDPEPLTVCGLKLAVAPAGKPEAPKLTAPLNPALAFTVTA